MPAAHRLIHHDTPALQFCEANTRRYSMCVRWRTQLIMMIAGRGIRLVVLMRVSCALVRMRVSVFVALGFAVAMWGVM